MCDRNAKSECILIKLRALVSESICERTTKFHEIILFVSWVINLQTRTTKYLFFQYSVAYCSHLSGSENPFDVLAIGDGVGCCEQSGAYRLVLHWSRYKVNGQYYRDILLHQQLLPAIRDLSGDLFTFQQDRYAPAHRARETVQLLTCETPDFIVPALWPANSPDLNPVDYQTWGKHRSRMHDVDQLKSRLMEEWEHFLPPGVHRWNDQAEASTSSSLHSSTFVCK